MKQKEITEYSLVEIKKIPHRIFTLPMPEVLWILEGHHKKENKTRQDILKLIINRAQEIINEQQE